jgi:hypothetical protein
MAGLPKKYAKMGFKKGWREYKKTKSQRKTTKKTNKKRRSGNTNFNFGGSLGKGIAVGVAAGVVNRFIPVNIAGADLIIAGIIMKDQTVQKIGAITLGRSLAGSFTGLATGQNGQRGGGY